MSEDPEEEEELLRAECLAVGVPYLGPGEGKFKKESSLMLIGIKKAARRSRHEYLWRLIAERQRAAESMLSLFEAVDGPSPEVGASSADAQPEVRPWEGVRPRGRRRRGATTRWWRCWLKGRHRRDGGKGWGWSSCLTALVLAPPPCHAGAGDARGGARQLRRGRAAAHAARCAAGRGGAASGAAAGAGTGQGARAPGAAGRDSAS
jgi:hypothetical protein